MSESDSGKDIITAMPPEMCLNRECQPTEDVDESSFRFDRRVFALYRTVRGQLRKIGGPGIRPGCKLVSIGGGVGENRREESSRAKAIGGSRGYRVDGCFGSDDQFEDHSFGGTFFGDNRGAGRSRRQGGHPQRCARRGNREGSESCRAVQGWRGPGSYTDECHCEWKRLRD